MPNIRVCPLIQVKSIPSKGIFGNVSFCANIEIENSKNSGVHIFLIVQM